MCFISDAFEQSYIFHVSSIPLPIFFARSLYVSLKHMYASRSEHILLASIFSACVRKAESLTYLISES